VAAFAATWIAAATLFTLYGHDLGRWMRAGLLPVVVLGMLTFWTAPDAFRPLRKPTDARKRPLRPSTRLAAAALFVAPLSFFVYVTQEPALAVCKNLAGRAGPGVPAVIVYLVPPLLVITGAVLAGLALRRLLPRTFAVIAGGRVPGAPRGRTLGPAPLQPGEPLEVAIAADERGPGLDGQRR
ncbi:MAG TPA: hypothetical protein VIK03_06195, partial [Thermoleophilia bacterium]